AQRDAAAVDQRRNDPGLQRSDHRRAVDRGEAQARPPAMTRRPATVGAGGAHGAPSRPGAGHPSRWRPSLNHRTVYRPGAGPVEPPPGQDFREPARTPPGYTFRAPPHLRGVRRAAIRRPPRAGGDATFAPPSTPFAFPVWLRRVSVKKGIVRNMP